MKTAIYIEDGVVQLVLTPENDFEKNAIASFSKKPVELDIFNGSFYDCRGGWTRFLQDSSDDKSLMLRISEKKIAEITPIYLVNGETKMTDEELLELAAKAAGYDAKEMVYMPGDDFERRYLSVDSEEWNPLEDDGDALRLAAKLRLLIKPGKHLGDGCTVEAQQSGIAGCTAFYDDTAEQMRRAIVHAAAEIGKAMP